MVEHVVHGHRAQQVLALVHDRRAHEVVGRVVSYAIEQSKSLDALTIEEYRRFSPLFADDLYDAITLESALATKSARGGTSPERVAAALARARAGLE